MNTIPHFTAKHSFLRFFLIVLSFIFISRIFEWMLLESFPHASHTMIILINGAVVSILMLPGLYFVVYRPMMLLLESEKKSGRRSEDVRADDPRYQQRREYRRSE
jgi:hypothetical protein